MFFPEIVFLHSSAAEKACKESLQYYSDGLRKMFLKLFELSSSKFINPKKILSHDPLSPFAVRTWSCKFR